MGLKSRWTFVISFVATFEKTKSGRIRLAICCVGRCIVIEKCFFTSLCFAAEFKRRQSVHDYSVDLLFVKNFSAFPTGFFCSLSTLPVVLTFSARKTRTLIALNRINHYKGTHHADVVFVYWSRLNYVILVKLESYINHRPLDALLVLSYCVCGELFVRLEKFFLFFLIIHRLNNR